MTILQSIILGIIQGFTEFIPVSSSGHLVLLPQVFGWEEQSLVFDTTVHLGTALALILYFWKDIYEIFTKKRSFGLKILVGTIPAAIIGFFFADFFETYFRDIYSVLLFLFLGSVLILVAEKYFRAPLHSEVTYGKSILVGFFQCLAFFPGVSRSGATISGGMLSGLRHKDAARFSFLLSIPIVVMAGGYKLLGAMSTGIALGPELVIGFLTSFLFGLFAIKFLMKFLQKKRLYVFVIYRLVLISVILLNLSIQI